jgi:hypothetical protein
MADLLAPPAPPPLAPDERRKLLSAARRHRAAWLDDLCVDLAATRRSRECSLVDAICADAIPSAGAVVRALCKAAGDDGAVLPPGAFVADALDLARAQPDATREGAAALAEALKHPRHAEAARALERGGRGLGDVAELAARLASEVGADVEAAEALVRRARALYGDAAAAATTVAAAPAAAPAPRAAQQRNRVTARAVRARRTGTSSSPS